MCRSVVFYTCLKIMKNKSLTLETVFGFMDKSYTLIWVNYDDNLDDNFDVLQQCLDDKSTDHLRDKITDWYIDAEHESVNEIIDLLKKQCIENGYGKSKVNVFFQENDDLIREEIYERDDSDVIGRLIGNTADIPIRVQLHSNYDCINSYWLESQGGYGYEETYFGDMVDALKLNPAKVKKVLLSKGEKVYGRFPNKKYREGKELVTYEDFYQELENTSCGANLLVFTAKIKATDLLKADFKINKIIIPKGNYCGIFSPFQGGGSVLEMTLLKDVAIKLYAAEYDYFSIMIDYPRSSHGYSITEVYGMCKSFFRNYLKISA